MQILASALPGFRDVDAPVQVQAVDTCAKCGAPLPAGRGAQGAPELCRVCVSALDQVLDVMMQQAAAGDPTLMAIKGYHVLREVGRGGDSGELAALKILLAEASVEPDMRDQFLREIANVQALHHPNIVGFRKAGFPVVLSISPLNIAMVAA